MNGTVRERMCLCMYATDPPKPRLERDIRFRSFSFTRLRPLLSASLFSSGPALVLQQVFTAGRIEQQSSPHPVLFPGP